ncbi:hypothetical protein BDA96_03G200900 [Sorghum bicolor]|uniref:Uncharacterized protein n=1 Tax=Sorghum bicolor TaxID=4558 RepID=A0A921RD84_SORBI|nr:hypothetical protein BDA96_03G200900 [Sorghum bicolor]
MKSRVLGGRDPVALAAPWRTLHGGPVEVDYQDPVGLDEASRSIHGGPLWIYGGRRSLRSGMAQALASPDGGAGPGASTSRGGSD